MTHHIFPGCHECTDTDCFLGCRKVRELQQAQRIYQEIQKAYPPLMDNSAQFNQCWQAANDNIATIERLKKYRHNARRAIKDLQRIATRWQDVAQKYMAMYRVENIRNTRDSRLLYFIAKKRAIEAGIVTEDDAKHVSGWVKIREWLDAKIREYEVENGIGVKKPDEETKL